MGSKTPPVIITLSADVAAKLTTLAEHYGCTVNQALEIVVNANYRMWELDYRGVDEDQLAPLGRADESIRGAATVFDRFPEFLAANDKPENPSS